MVQSAHIKLHRSNKKMTLSATQEFWHSPIANDSSTSTSDDDGDETMSLVPAHHQLLHKNDDCSFANLNGYDHTRDVISYDNLDRYQEHESCRQKLSSVKHQGGGSWLLGFARLNNDKDKIPGLVRVPSGASLESDDSSTSSEESLRSSASSSPKSKPRGVSFSPAVKVQPIPDASSLSPVQRRKMYSTSFEVRQNKIRNKREYRYDGYDWRNITEEWEMGVDMVTGELVHPVHEHS